MCRADERDRLRKYREGANAAPCHTPAYGANCAELLRQLPKIVGNATRLSRATLRRDVTRVPREIGGPGLAKMEARTSVTSHLARWEPGKMALDPLSDVHTVNGPAWSAVSATWLVAGRDRRCCHGTTRMPRRVRRAPLAPACGGRACAARDARVARAGRASTACEGPAHTAYGWGNGELPARQLVRSFFLAPSSRSPFLRGSRRAPCIRPDSCPREADRGSGRTGSLCAAYSGNLPPQTFRRPSVSESATVGSAPR